MPLVPAICTQCGAQIEVDNTHEAGICKHCGTAFITEKAINKYNTNITNNNNFSGAHINVNNYLLYDADELFDICFKCCEKREYNSFDKIYNSFLQWYPTDYRVYYISLLKETHSFSRVLTIEEYSEYRFEQYIESLEDSMKKIQKSANDVDVSNIYEEYNSYISRIRTKYKQSTFESDEYIPSKNPNVSFLKLKEIIGNRSGYVYTSTFEHEVFKGLNNTKKLPVCTIRRTGGKIYFEFLVSSSPYKEGYYISWELIDLDDTGKFSFVNKSSNYLLKKMYLHSIVEGGNTIVIKFIFEDKINKSIGTRSYELQLKSEGCYIATCVYGSYDCPQVWTLRRFRDDTLDKTWYGRLFIKFYYSISPIIVKWFGNKKWFKTFWRKCLDNMVSKLNQYGIEDTQYTDKY